MSVVKYPLTFDSSGRLVLTKDIASELRVLFLHSQNTRVDEPEYGIGVERLLQTSLSNNEVLALSLIRIREAITKYIPQGIVTSITAENDKVGRTLNIFVRYRKSPEVEDTFKLKIPFSNPSNPINFS
jgi:phage baseplate assembly protein W